MWVYISLYLVDLRKDKKRFVEELIQLLGREGWTAPTADQVNIKFLRPFLVKNRKGISLLSGGWSKIKKSAVPKRVANNNIKNLVNLISSILNQQITERDVTGVVKGWKPITHGGRHKFLRDADVFDSIKQGMCPFLVFYVSM